MIIKENNLYTIGELSEQTGVSRRMIRYYEKYGFLVGVRRGDNGYRLYNDEHIRVVAKIPELLLLGFSLEEILLSWQIKQIFLTKKDPEEYFKKSIKNKKEVLYLKEKVNRILSNQQKYISYLKRMAKYMDRIND